MRFVRIILERLLKCESDASGFKITRLNLEGCGGASFNSESQSIIGDWGPSLFLSGIFKLLISQNPKNFVWMKKNFP